MKNIMLCLVGVLIGAAAMHAALVTREPGAGRVEATRGLANPSQNPAESGPTEGLDFVVLPDEVLATIEGRQQELAAYLDRAETDPGAVLEDVLARKDYWFRRYVLERIASAWAERDPRAAVAHIRALRTAQPPDRFAMLRAAVMRWSGADPDGVVSFLLSADGRNLIFSECACGEAVAGEVARLRPNAVLAVTDSMVPGRDRSLLRGAALPGVVAEDLDYALRQVDRMTPGADRRLWIDAIAPVYAALDPENAQRWARRIDATAPGVLDSVQAAIGR